MNERQHENRSASGGSNYVRSIEALQRKCACGGSSGLTGSCSNCEKKKLLGKLPQTRLRVNEPGDEYEQEADRLAEEVMRMPKSNFKPKPSISPRASLNVPRGAAADTGLDEAPAIVHDVLSSPGRPLDNSTRGFFDWRIGHDFGSVRIHADAEAAKSARSVNALAYTVGSDVVFGAGQYSPGTTAGQRLLAHELMHVVQQGGTDAVPVAPSMPRMGLVSGVTSVPRLVQREPDETTGSCNDMVFCTHLNLPFPMKDRYFVGGEETDESSHDARIASESSAGKCNINLTQEVGVNLGPLNPWVTVNFFYRGEPCCTCFRGNLSWNVAVNGTPQAGLQGVRAGSECSSEKCCDVKTSLPVSITVSLGAKFNVSGTIQLDGSTYKQTS